MLKCVPSPICWIHEWRGRPGRRRQPGLEPAPVLVLVGGDGQDQNGSRFLLLRPVVMRGELACGHRVLPHGRTTSFVSRRWYPEHREGRSGRQLLCFWQSFASVSRGSYAGNACGRPQHHVNHGELNWTQLNSTVTSTSPENLSVPALIPAHCTVVVLAVMTINRPLCWLIDWSIDRWIDWLIGWLIDCFFASIGISAAGPIVKQAASLTTTEMWLNLDTSQWWWMV